MPDLTKVVFIDFECYSECDLKRHGAYLYAQHSSTEVLCLSYKFLGEDKTYSWYPSAPGIYPEPPKRLLQAVLTGYTIVAHNMFFDWCIWNEHCYRRMRDWQYMRLEQIQDTMAQCAASSIPLGLDDSCKALGFDAKHQEGQKAMHEMCKPKKPTKDDPRKRIFDPLSLYDLVAYCEQDVAMVEKLWAHLPQLPEKEHSIWELTMQINIFGIPVDTRTVKAAIALWQQVVDRYRHELALLTDFKITSGGQTARMKKWLLEEHRMDIQSLTAKGIERLLKTDMPEDAKRLLELRQILGRSSIAKFQKALDRVDENDIARENLIYAGAGPGRWTSKGLQIHNLTKYKYESEDMIELTAGLINAGSLDAFEVFYPQPSKPLAGYMRPCIWNRGSATLYCADFSSVEARGVLWLAGEDEALQLLADGGDLYKELASDIYSKPVEDISKESDERDLGKRGVLGGGYGIGGTRMKGTIEEQSLIDTEELGKHLVTILVKAGKMDCYTFGRLFFNSWRETDAIKVEYARYVADWKNPNIDAVEDNPGELNYGEAAGNMLVKSYRDRFKKVPVYWKNINEAAIEAILYEKPVDFGHIRFIPTKDFLYIELPSGRRIAYFKARVVSTVNKFGNETHEVRYYGVDSQTQQFVPQHMFGGKWTENVSSGICRDIMAEAMLRVAKEGYRILFTVHDEILSANMDGDFDEYLALMRQKPEWAKDFPVDADGWQGSRYRK